MYYQERVAERVKAVIVEVATARGHLLTRRPFQSFWFASQISLCIALWEHENTMYQALELAKAFLIPLETLDVLWPCDGERIGRGHDVFADPQSL